MTSEASPQVRRGHREAGSDYSHSIVAGGLLDMS